MFSFFKSEHAKLRDAAKNWLYAAGKVYHFRKDLIGETDAARLLQLMELVKAENRRKSDSARLRSSMEELKAHLEEVGGNYYPRGSIAENVEFFFAAAIIYVGFTTFFVKPFKIPTNSMWPTYNGMTGEVYHEGEPAPGAIEKAFRFVAYGAKRYDVKAPADGEVLVPMVRTTDGPVPLSTRATVKRYFLLNAAGREYSFFVGREQVDFKFFSDFDLFKQVVEPLSAAGIPNPYANLPRRLHSGNVADQLEMTVPTADGRGTQRTPVYLVKTGIVVKKGETILEFDLMTGDQLFVDRMSYHFTSPKSGDGFVFKTGRIPRLGEDKFYIKRLVGTPGDQVRIEGSGLLVNGEPAEGSPAFDWNAEKSGNYQGYTADPPKGDIILDLSEDVTVPPDRFLALGDNSYHSYDSRGWGFVPKDSVVGRPIMIYYPFTRRFGLSK